MALGNRRLTAKEIKERTRKVVILSLIIILGLTYLFITSNEDEIYRKVKTFTSELLGRNDLDYSESYSLEDIPEYDGFSYIVINDNSPFFEDDEITTSEYEYYSELDYLGRCGVAKACVGTELMPTEERDDISSVRPSGWQSIKADDVDGGWLYNRCHLLMYALTGENANECNLITGTRYLNTEGMLPFEEMVLDYIRETDNHVMYRVTPIYEGKELVARGVEMEAYSVEDNGEGICFNVYCFNIQEGYEIDYLTGAVE